MDQIRVGPSGNSKIFYEEGNSSSLQAPKWLKSKNLSAYEYSFGRGYNMNYSTAESLGKEAVLNDIMISVHAPYYINFANLDDEMVNKSFKYVLSGLNFLKAFNGEKLVIHIASQGKLLRDDAIALTRKRLQDCLEIVYDNFDMNNKYICPETMGKYLQIGSHEEIIDLCTMDDCLIPTFDFGHINCILQGNLKTEEDYKKIFDLSFEKLGSHKTKNCHIHFSKIKFGDKGEINHLDFDDVNFGPEFMPLAHVIKEYGLTPTIICESSSKMAEDAIFMNEILNSLK